MVKSSNTAADRLPVRYFRSTELAATPQAGSGVVMTPYSDVAYATPMTTANNYGAQVKAWKCVPSSTTIAKYLPGSCK